MTSPSTFVRGQRVLVVAALTTTLASIAGATQRAPSGDFFGLPHTALGAADLVLNPDGTLTVSNIGSSGQDGVSIDLGGTQGWSGELDIPAPSPMPLDPRTILKTYFETGDIPTEQQFSTLIDSFVGGQVGVGLGAFSEAPSCVRVELFNAGQLVQRADFIPPLPTHLVVGNIGSSGKDGVTVETNGTSSGKRKQSLYFPETSLVAIDGSSAVAADSCRFTLDGLPPGEPVTRRIDIILEAELGGSITLHAEGIIHRDIATRALGGAHLEGHPARHTCHDCLVISNIGSSGDDGVEFGVGIGQTDITNVELAYGTPVSLLDVPPFVLSTTAAQSLDGLPPGEPVHATLSVEGPTGGAGAGGRIAVQYDAAAGASNAIVEVYDNGTYVGATTVPLSPTGPTDLGALSFTTEFAGDRYILRAGAQPQGGGPPTISMSYVFTTPVDYDDGAGTAILTGNEIRVLPDALVGPVNNVPTVSITAENAPDLSIGDITASPPEPVVVSFGIEHEDIGDASATDDPSGNLVISNIGSSGKDGVSMNLGEAEGARLEFAGAGLDLSVPGHHTDCVAYDALGRIVARVSSDNLDPTTAQLGFDISGEPTVNVHLYDENGLLLASFPLNRDDVLTLSATQGNPIVSTSLAFRRFELPMPTRTHFQGGEIIYRLADSGAGSALTVAAPGVPPVQTVAVVIIAGLSTISASLPTRVELLARDTGDITLSDIGVVQFSTDHFADGVAHILGESCAIGHRLVVSNIGSSGLDGVTMDHQNTDSDGDGLPDQDEIEAVSFVLDPSASLDDGAIQTFTWTQVGAVNGTPDTQITSVSQVLVAGSQRQVIVSDFAPFSPAVLDVRILDEFGNVLDEALGLAPGLVATVQGDAPAGEYRARYTFTAAGALRGGSSADEAEECLIWEIKEGMSLPGGTMVLGKEIRITARPPAGGAPGTVRLDASQTIATATAGDSATYAIRDETVTRVATPCPGDTNGDQQVNTDDFLAVLSNWGACPAPCPPACMGDTNDDCVVDTDDFLAVLSNWGPCIGP